MIRIGVIGCGYWGPNLIRNFHDNDRSAVAMVCDLDPAKLARATRFAPTAQTTTDVATMLASDIDAVVIATPVSSHYELALAALEAGKHVLIEKPMAATSVQCARLIEEATRRGLVLMVDHTFVYTGAVRKIRELIQNGDLGQVYYYDSVRVNLGLFQHDVDVLWDLAVHDLSIIEYVLGRHPVAVSASGVSHVAGSPANLAFLTLFFDDETVAHVNANWLAPVKIRRTLIGGSKKMIVYDDLEPSEKIKIYDKGITVAEQDEEIYKMLIGYRVGDMWAPVLDSVEALRREADHFLDCIENRQRPETDGAMGQRVVEILEAASQSMRERGQPVALSERTGE